MTRRIEARVAIAGGGMAGLCAAIAALERGASVVVLEKGARAGGSMWLSNGLIWTFADKAQLREDVRDGNKALQDLLVDALPDALTWLGAQGVELAAEQTFQWYGRGRRANPAQMTPALLDRIASLGGRVLTGTSLDRLIFRDDGAVTGIRAFDRQGALEVRARSVILATGGFQGNAELLARYVTPHADNLILRSNPCSTGDGLLAAVEAGAALTPLMNAYYGHALVASPARFSELEFQSASQKYGNLAVALDLRGERFADESAGTGEEAINFHIGSRPGAAAVYVIDAAMCEMESPNNPPPRAAIDRARAYGGAVLDAGSLEELAQGLSAWGIPPSTALASIRAYNAAVESGDCADLWPPRSRNRFPITKPPFCAVMVRSAITYTCGGLQADLDMRVLRRSTSVSTMSNVIAPSGEMSIAEIPGLYVAGCDLGGVSTVGYIGGLAHALVTGKTAGETAADGA